MKVKTFEWHGKTITKKDLVDMTGWSQATIDRRLYAGWSVDQILDYSKEKAMNKTNIGVSNSNPCANKTIYECTHCKRSRCIYDDIRRNKK